MDIEDAVTHTEQEDFEEEFEEEEPMYDANAEDMDEHQETEQYEDEEFAQFMVQDEPEDLPSYDAPIPDAYNDEDNEIPLDAELTMDGFVCFFVIP